MLTLGVSTATSAAIVGSSATSSPGAAIQAAEREGNATSKRVREPSLVGKLIPAPREASFLGGGRQGTLVQQQQQEAVRVMRIKIFILRTSSSNTVPLASPRTAGMAEPGETELEACMGKVGQAAAAKLQEVVDTAAMHRRRDELWQKLTTKLPLFQPTVLQPTAEYSGIVSEAEVQQLMHMAWWLPIEKVDPSLKAFFGMGISWAQLFRYLGDVYRERARALVTPQSRHLFLMSTSPDLLIHFVMPSTWVASTPLMSSPWAKVASPSLASASSNLPGDITAAETSADTTGGTGQPRLYVCRRLTEAEEDKQEEADLTTLVNTLCTFLTHLLVNSSPPNAKG